MFKFRKTYLKIYYSTGPIWQVTVPSADPKISPWRKSSGPPLLLSPEKAYLRQIYIHTNYFKIKEEEDHQLYSRPSCREQC